MSIDQKELHDFEKWLKDKVSDQIYLDLIERWIDGIYNGYNHMNPPPDIPTMKLITKLHKKWKDGDMAVWITISPDHLKNPIKFSKFNLKRVSEFCEKWFCKQRYSYYSYVIEVGKNEDDPHIHIHALVQFANKSMAKNHARDLKNYWSAKMCHTLKGKDYLSKNVSGIYRNDKLQYMKNCAKGSHENYCADPYSHHDVEGRPNGSYGELL